jgi:O-antigen/teichoic acid export membrane protein
MSTARQIVKNMFSLSAAELAAKGLGVFFSLYLMRTIGPENFGIFSSAKALVFGFIVLVYLGFEQIGIREVARDKSKLQKYASLIFSIRFVIAIVCTIVLVILMEFFLVNDPSYEIRKTVTYIYAILILGNVIFLNWAYQAVEKMHIIAIRSVLVNLLNLVGLFIFVHNENDLILAVWIIVISNLINLFWMLFHFIKYYGMPKLYVDLDLWKSLIGESFRVGIVFLITTLYSIITLQILTYISGNHQTGIYSAAFQIMVLCLIPSNILQQAFFPQIARSNSKEEKNTIVSKYILINVLSGTFIAFTLFVYSDLIIVLLGKKYDGTNYILKILAISVLIQYLSTCFFSPLIAWKKENIVVWANVAGLIIILIVNLLLVPGYGYFGAAIATVFCELGVLLVLLRIFYKEQGKLFINEILKVIAVGIPGFAVGYLFLNYGMNIYLSFLISTLIFILLNLYFNVVNIKEIKLILKK